MSIESIKKYNDKIKKARLDGLDNEENIREYFYELLKNYTNPINIEIGREISINLPSKNRVKPDGRITKAHLTLGYIENKDRKDNLYKEIESKIKKGYPTENIIFEDSNRLVLYQASKKILDVEFDDEESIHDAIKQFLSFKPSDLIEFENALDNLKTLIPQLASELRAFFSEEKKVNKEFKDSLYDFCESCRNTINDIVKTLENIT